MIRKSVILAGCMAAAAAALGASPASATAVTYNALNNGIAPTLTDWTNSLLFPAFNPNLGTLESVSITVTDGYTTGLVVTNGASSASAGNTFASVAMGFDDPNHLLTGTQLIISGQTVLQSAIYSSTSPQMYNLAPGATAILAPLSGTGVYDSGMLTSSSFLQEFEGTGDVPLQVSTYTTTSISNNGGNTTTSQSTSVGANGTVTYTFASINVPEPMSMALLGSGLFVFGLLRRRTR